MPYWKGKEERSKIENIFKGESWAQELSTIHEKTTVRKFQVSGFKNMFILIDMGQKRV